MFNDANNIIHFFHYLPLHTLFSFPTRNKNEKALGLKRNKMKTTAKAYNTVLPGLVQPKKKDVYYIHLLCLCHRLYTPTFVGTYIVNQAYGVRCCASVSNMYAS